MRTELPVANVPFVTAETFEIKADLFKLEADPHGSGSLFCVDAEYPKFVLAKLEQLNKHPQHCRLYLQDHPEALTTCLRRTAQLIADDQPEHFDFRGTFKNRLLGLSIDGDGELEPLPESAFPELRKGVLEHLLALPPLDRLCDFLALSLQEDLIVTHKPDSSLKSDRAEMLLACLPSRWDPAEKLGQDFGSIHAPVADNAALLKAQPQLIKAMTFKGPFVRYNWSLSSSALAQNPVLVPETELPEQPYYRVERQTFFPFPDLNRSLFAIRILQVPLEEMLELPGHADTFRKAIQSMSPALKRYKRIRLLK